jgi:predicted transcriptional regulator
MTPMDDDILELFHSSHLVLTPSIIAYNTGYSREEVNRRLRELTENGLMKRVERGKYRITTIGENYLTGKYPVQDEINGRKRVSH